MAGYENEKPCMKRLFPIMQSPAEVAAIQDELSFQIAAKNTNKKSLNTNRQLYHGEEDTAT